MSTIGGGITTDFWTDDHQRNPYLSITAHYIDDNWHLRCTLLGIFAWDPNQRQTGDNFQNFLMSVSRSLWYTYIIRCADILLILQKLEEFDLSGSTLKHLIFVTDEGANIMKGLRNEARLNCTAHILNNVMKNVFEKHGNEISEVQSLNACAELVGFIRRSHVKAVSLCFALPF